MKCEAAHPAPSVKEKKATGSPNKEAPGGARSVYKASRIHIYHRNVTTRQTIQVFEQQ